VGSIKYDPSEAQSDAIIPLRILGSYCIEESRPILFGGSTHAGEEEILARAFLRLRPQFPKLVLVIAPRHVERTREITSALQALGLRVGLRSAADEHPTAEPDCLLLDTTGELRNWYAVATAVFIGKSLSTTGGQNPVEPILAGKPVVFGPHMENFAALADALRRADAAIEIRDPDELAESVAELLRSVERRAELVANALQVLAQHRGATQRTAELLLALQLQTAARA
jgi:3-deoxy-D-manno-octulosonic-acid transferase